MRTGAKLDYRDCKPGHASENAVERRDATGLDLHLSKKSLNRPSAEFSELGLQNFDHNLVCNAVGSNKPIAILHIRRVV